MEEKNTVDIPVNESVVETTTQTQTQETPIESVKTEVEKEKVFTQAQLDEIVINRLSKEKARFLKKLGVEEESQIDEIISKTNSLEEAKKQLETYEQELTSLKTTKVLSDKKQILNQLQADSEFVDYLIDKIDGDTIDDFEKNAKQYLETNKRFVVETYNPVKSSLDIKGQTYPDFTNMTTEQYLEWRSKNKL